MDREPGDVAPEPDTQAQSGHQPRKVHTSALFGDLKDQTTVKMTIEDISRLAAQRPPVHSP